VLGATGQQGGAVVRSLLDRGVAVRALVRRTDDPAAQRLAEQGVRVVRADTDDPGRLPEALTDLRALFVMTVFASAGPAGEVIQGRRVAEAAAAAAVPHVVYSSVGGADRASGVPHFESKWAIEQHLRQTGLPTSVIRPTFFMENFLQSMRPALENGGLVLRAPLGPTVPLQMIAVHDIGAVAAAVLIDPDIVASGSVEIAGDERTPEEVANALGRRAGTPARFEATPVDTISDDDTRAMFAWLAAPPAYRADLALTRRLHPAIQSFDGFLSTSNFEIRR
ncbi:MAG: NmrA/HSCARG family protein, partial [Propionibacteriaceae bacterium]